MCIPKKEIVQQTHTFLSIVLRRSDFGHLRPYFAFLLCPPSSNSVSPTPRNPRRNRRVYWCLGAGIKTSRCNAGSPAQTHFVAVAWYSLIGAGLARWTATVTLAMLRLACPTMTVKAISCSLKYKRKQVDGRGVCYHPPRERRVRLGVDIPSWGWDAQRRENGGGRSLFKDRGL
jgi:hypothetical protein